MLVKHEIYDLCVECCNADATWDEREKDLITRRWWLRSGFAAANVHPRVLTVDGENKEPVFQSRQSSGEIQLPAVNTLSMN